MHLDSIKLYSDWLQSAGVFVLQQSQKLFHLFITALISMRPGVERESMKQ